TAPNRITVWQAKESHTQSPGQFIEIEGVVTYADNDAGFSIIEDETGGIRLDSPEREIRLYAGDYVKAIGSLHPATQGLSVQALMIQITGTRTLPSARAVPIANLSGTNNYERVVISGVLRSLSEDKGRSIYRLGEGGRIVTVRLNSLSKQGDVSLVGKKIYLEGVCKFDLKPPLVTPEIELLVGRADLLNLRIAHPDAPTLPLTQINKLSEVKPAEPVRLRVTVLEFHPAKRIRVKDKSGEIIALTEQWSPLVPGALIDVIGFTSARGATLRLEDCVYQRIGVADPAQIGVAPSSALPRLDTAAAIRRLPESEAKLGYPVRLRGVITYYDPIWNLLFFQGATEGIYVMTGNQELDVKSGQLAVLTGNTGPGAFAPIVQNPSFDILSDGPMPDAKPVTFGEMLTGAQDSQWVKVRGLVRSLKRLQDHLDVTIAAPVGPGLLHAYILRPEKNTPISFGPGSEVEALGACATDFNSLRQLAGVNLYCPAIEFVRTFNRESGDPYARKLVQINSLLRFDPDKLTNQLVHVQGVITYSSENIAYIQDKTGAIRVESEEPNEARVGDSIEIVGLLHTSGTEQALSQLHLRKISSLPMIAPVAITAENVFDPNTAEDGGLVSIEGTFLERTGFKEQTRLLIQSDDFLYSAVGAPRRLRPLGKIYPGSRVRVTGICSVQENEMRQAKSFRILLRSAADVLVLQEPPFWDSKRLRTIAGGLAFLSLVTVAWVTTLRRRVKSQLKVIQKNMSDRQSQERRFTEFAEHFPGTAFIKDSSGRYLFANRAFAALLCKDPEKVLGCVDSELGSGDWLRNRTREDIKVKESACVHEVEEVFPSDPNRSWLTTRFCISNSVEEPLICGIGVETTTLKTLEQQLMQAQKMESIGVLAGGVAHDFNNILTLIQGYASILESQELPAEISDAAQQISRAVTRASDLTRQLLMFSRKQPLKTATLDVNSVAQNIFKMLERTLGEDICLDLKLASGALLVEADKGMIEQILVNLAVNSRDAMPGGGTFTIETERRLIAPVEASHYRGGRAGNFVMLRVIDSGSGIPAENLKKIFEPFFTTKEVGRGTGLGLATVFGIVKQHGGWIQVSSVIRRGTTFEIFLPESPRTKETTVPPSAETNIQGGRESILFVEDEEMLRILMKQLLETKGYKVITADCARAAQEILEKGKIQFDAVVTDIVMPGGMSGRELAAAIRARHPALPVILASGYCSEINTEAGRDLKTYPFLEKPYSIDQLQTIIQQTLAKNLGKL
ncbi:MAG: multi-sensor hybrid histidine kinase, partial [Verrucomicrobiales bacterium]|nr:multi-sensor hybrid histidine kinase [Verrucomicrobiales bacterium]